MLGFRSAFAPSVLTITSAVIVCVTTFLPWYQTAIGPIGAPDALSGWDATAWGKLAVASAAICALCALIVAVDIRGEISLHGPVRRILAGTALAAAVVVCAVVLYRLAVPPSPAIGATRELGLMLATVAAITGVYGALGQFSRTFPDAHPRRPSRQRRPRHDSGPDPDASR